jgi:peptidyl-prolyl cis-trans isomerase B (cyclophilin B)
VPVKSHLRARWKPLFAALLFVALIALAGCAQTAQPAQTPQTPETAPPATDASAPPAAADASSTTPQEGALYTPKYIPNGREVAVIKTNKGTVKVKLYGKDAPINAGNFIELAMKGFYDGVKFHRLEPGFVVQGGDPQTTKLTSAQVKKLVADQNAGSYNQGDPMLGTGGPGYVIKGEFDPNNVVHKHVDGTLAMARTTDPNSAGSQFYFTLAPQPPLDGKYTVFGDTTEGLKVVHALGVGDVIQSITIENATK